MKNEERGKFSGRLGFVLSAAGASVGLGNIWRFPYLAARYGGGAFLLVYIILAATFGYTMIIAETSIGRSCKRGPVGAFNLYSKSKGIRAGGWLNAVIPILIVPYYSVIGGWVCKYLYEFICGDMNRITSDTFFTDFITSGWEAEIWFAVFIFFVLAVIWLGVNNGIERVSKFMMPVLVILSIVICIYTLTRPGALEGVKYLLIPDFSHFSWMTVVSAMGQMFYSLSIAMGILITFGSYMKDDTSIDHSTIQVEIFDTAIAILAGLMIIPAVFAFFGGNPETLNQGPALMFITMPRIFADMAGGRLIGILFFVLVLFAALTSAIALCESAVSTFVDEFGWSRYKGTSIMAVIILLLGTLSCLGYGPLAGVKLIGMQFLDFFDFMTNSVMMPIAAIFICLLVTKHMGLDKIEAEVTKGGHSFSRKKIFNFMIRYVCVAFAFIILLSSIASAFGWIKI
ncbi:MAG: sodium-dependent transporter [Erysipelotrichaceae bacterium]|nr:sodium-dependent transporter [Erysipelotrichaceae bacterium]